LRRQTDSLLYNDSLVSNLGAELLDGTNDSLAEREENCRNALHSWVEPTKKEILSNFVRISQWTELLRRIFSALH